MRTTLRLVMLVFILLALLAPLTVYASGGPCPDDLEAAKDCAKQAPPFYVVINRTFDRLGAQYGTGCVPWILENPDCDDCDDMGNPACTQAAIDVEQIICGDQMPLAGAVDGDILYEMCCNCGGDPDGAWMYRTRELNWNDDIGAWECPEYSDWMEGLPPETGIDLPAPLVVGGLAIAGVALVGTGFAVRRRTARIA